MIDATHLKVHRTAADLPNGRCSPPIFASLPRIRTRHEVRIRRSVLAGVCFIAVFGISGGFYALHIYYIPMDMLVERVIEKIGLAPFFGQIRQDISG